MVTKNNKTDNFSMIITKTPMRISFFGGGTDYPSWVRKNGGAVLSTSINKYSYLHVHRLPPFFLYKTKVVWSRIEEVNNHDEIIHPSVRETLNFLGFDDGISIHYNGDLPARSGMGSSSSFTVGLLHALYALTGVNPDKKKLGEEAIKIEQEYIKETVGCQDQIACSFGGFNKIQFNKDGTFSVHPINIKESVISELQDHLILFFTGLSRTASEIAVEQVKNIKDKTDELNLIRDFVDDAIDLLKNEKEGWQIRFGEMLNENWQIKKKLSSKISNDIIDDFYSRALRAGAIGGKILGAGGGGFLLIYAPPSEHQKIKKELSNLLYVPFKFEKEGSQIIYKMK